jgi:hypothetical protein
LALKERGDQIMSTKKDKSNMPVVLRHFLEGVSNTTADAIWLYLDGDPRSRSEMIKVVIGSHPSIVTEAPSKKTIYETTMTKKHKILHVVTGPLTSGKSTYVHRLAEELGTPHVGEYQFGVDIGEKKWWEELEEYAEDHGTIIVEVHFEHKGRDVCDHCSKKKLPEEAPHIRPPDHVKIHWILPEVNQLFKQQKSRDRLSLKEDAEFDLQYYQTLKDKMS